MFNFEKSFQSNQTGPSNSYHKQHPSSLTSLKDKNKVEVVAEKTEKSERHAKTASQFTFNKERSIDHKLTSTERQVKSSKSATYQEEPRVTDNTISAYVDQYVLAASPHNENLRPQSQGNRLTNVQANAQEASADKENEGQLTDK